MSFYQFARQQLLSVKADELWEFISSPNNLKEITPDYMGFDIIPPLVTSTEMYPGMIISYVVRPLFGIKTNWVTEITHIRSGQYFTDEQRIGPYKLWHHQHMIEPIPNGTLMKDIVTYQPPFGFLGALANKLIIKHKLNEIFNYREAVFAEKFGII